uniref:Mitochondrial import receptor subunit TOM20 homolog n=1 Tax=Maylandia zebra TaxID=106582 RepID=A0A3P9BT61_9CICH
MLSGRTSALVAGVCGALFIAYCVYFDRKRRSDPRFKEKLRERRRKQKVSSEKTGLTKLPNLKDEEAVQKFFLEEIQLAEELLAQGQPHRPFCCTGSKGVGRRGGGGGGGSRGGTVRATTTMLLWWCSGEYGASARMWQSSTSALLSHF